MTSRHSIIAGDVGGGKCEVALVASNNRFRQNIYVLEDDDAVRDAILELLRLNDYTAMGFARPEALLEAYDGKPGCLLLDVHLSGAENGLSFARKYVVGRLPLVLVVMSGSLDLDQMRMMDLVNPAAFLRKPFSQKSLLDALDHAETRYRDRVSAGEGNTDGNVFASRRSPLLTDGTGLVPAEAAK